MGGHAGTEGGCAKLSFSPERAEWVGHTRPQLQPAEHRWHSIAVLASYWGGGCSQQAAAALAVLALLCSAAPQAGNRLPGALHFEVSGTFRER